MHHYGNTSNETLRKRGYRLTPQRYMILSVIEEAEEHLSIDQILERVQKRNPYVSLSTIYRTLELLRELGLVRENHLPGQQPRYEIAEGKAHHHLVCRAGSIDIAPFTAVLSHRNDGQRRSCTWIVGCLCQ